MTCALVTGGTAGIGAAFARQLAKRGDDLILVARDEERLAALASDLPAAYGISVETIRADLSVREDVDRVAARLEDAARPVDLLVNNAGFGMSSSLLDADYAEQERALDVMGLAPVVLGGAAGRAMKARGRGTIINVGSLSGHLTAGGYSTVKAYANVYSEALATELHGSGVTVTGLQPGWVTTEFHERADIKTSAIPGFLWVKADTLAANALADAAKGRVISVPNPLWKLAYHGLRHLPRGTIRFISRMLTRSRA
ncbi:SDR family NAD(P)-dependent oxidoreductase [Nigerium massiliense]|uniref:SDR family NAD(P)-dependent oxidoreductase n=1 Tax=Nigerium massiliense TaxID=1522317 RepID=UPI00058E599C|nr:SDR family NAD(P)-dependent oxidoreductase [Nigerium massiliense]